MKIKLANGYQLQKIKRTNLQRQLLTPESILPVFYNARLGSKVSPNTFGPESIEKTAFTVKNDNWKFTRMSFRLMCPTTFQQ